MVTQNHRKFIPIHPLFFALLSILLFQFQYFDSSSDEIKVFEIKNETETRSREFADINGDIHGISQKNYMVRFREYKKAQDHKDYLENNLGLKGWKWIERKNPASLFPTDFGLVSIEDLFRPDLVEEFGKLGLVKDVSVEASYSRTLLAENQSKRNANKAGKTDFHVENHEKRNAFLNEKKRPGKIFTAMPSGEEYGTGLSNFTISWKRKLMQELFVKFSWILADALWSKGSRGAKVKMAIFDTGIRANHPHFRNIKERTNWTNEDTLNDNLGHGTLVAGVIAGGDAECLGFAPDTEIYAFRVFTDAEVSYTSWFLDAFNYAIATNMDVLNLSFGGPNYLDLPFVEKVWELTANNIIMISAIGNDGPLYGTLNKPADQNDVIGVGGIDYNDHIASFSSRGMSTWEIPHGYGRVKPDVVTCGQEVMGSAISTGCKSLSGTSAASPVVAGVVCLLVSAIPENSRKDTLNPASMKQALVEGAAKLSGPNMFEQGAGRVNLLESYEILKKYRPRASIFPSVLDYTDCPYTWPFCRQPLYAGAMPIIFNATILNGMGVSGYVETPPTWQPSHKVGNLLSIHFSYSDVIWPWTGFLALHMQIREEGAQFAGTIEGNVTVRIYSPSPRGEKDPRRSTCVLRLKLRVIPTPKRSKRVLWVQYHNIKYPPGYIPRDSLDVHHDILDWHGDHLHTNFHNMFNMLRDAGYYVETLGSPLTCFDASQYGTLLMVDLEDEYFKEEIEKLRDDVVNGGLGLAVFGEWYNLDTMVKMRFFDDNTRSWWTPVTGGANIPALNELLVPFGIAFGDKILKGDFSIDGEQSHYASGTDIVKFPGGSYVHGFEFQDNTGSGATQNVLQDSGTTKVESAILGFTEIGDGRIAVFGDSNCLDSSYMVTDCYWLLGKILNFTSENITDPVLFSDPAKKVLALHKEENQLPSRRTDMNFSTYSAVIGKDLICGSDARFEVWGAKGCDFQFRMNRKMPGYPILHLGRRGSNLTTKSSDLGQVIKKKNKGNVSTSIRRKQYSRKMDFLGLLNGEELDIPMLFTAQWLLPFFVAITGILLLSIWRMQQRRQRWRRRKGLSRFAG